MSESETNVIKMHRAEVVPTRRPIEDDASNRLDLARRGVPGIYVVDPSPNESFFFEVRSYYTRRFRKLVIHIVPISLWEDGECVERAPEPAPDLHVPFLPSCVFYGQLDFMRLPDEHYQFLEFWANVALDGFEQYNLSRAQKSRQAKRR